jgi:hypothetical protein
MQISVNWKIALQQYSSAYCLNLNQINKSPLRFLWIRRAVDAGTPSRPPIAAIRLQDGAAGRVPARLGPHRRRKFDIFAP